MLKQHATNEKTCTVFVQDVSHNINLMRMIEYDISPIKYTNTVIFCLFESAAIVFGSVPVLVSTFPGAQELVSWR